MPKSQGVVKVKLHDDSVVSLKDINLGSSGADAGTDSAIRTNDANTQVLQSINKKLSNIEEYLSILLEIKL